MCTHTKSTVFTLRDYGEQVHRGAKFAENSLLIVVVLIAEKLLEFLSDVFRGWQ